MSAMAALFLLHSAPGRADCFVEQLPAREGACAGDICRRTVEDLAARVCGGMRQSRFLVCQHRPGASAVPLLLSAVAQANGNAIVAAADAESDGMRTVVTRL